jgi:myo-inositol 2-dehydrogenase/D-chiro-inositol 1-dehydrogenase
MNIGLVGVGRIGVLHAVTLKGLDRIDRVVVADADPAQVRAVAKELAVRGGIEHLLTSSRGLP